MSISSTQALLVIGAALLIGIAGCSAAPASDEEAQSSTSSKLLAPQASVTSAASAETKAKYGITHWKIFRGKQNMVMTGYDENDHAVKGVTLGFAQSDEGNAQIVTKIDDGSNFTAVHDFTHCENYSPQPLGSDSQDFITSLASDATTIEQMFASRAQSTSSSDSQCGADMAGVLTKALQCLGGSTSTAAQAACVTAAQKASSSASSCQYTGSTSSTTTNAPSGGVLANLPSYTSGQSPFDAGELESTIANVLSSPFASGGGCDIAKPFGDGALANILGSFSNGDCSYDQGGGSSFGGFSASDLGAFSGFDCGGGGGDY